MKILDVKNLIFKVKDKVVLDNINFSVNEMEYVLLNGLNGSGKSTFLKILANDIDPSQYPNSELWGEILDKSNNNILDRRNREEFSRKICYIPQEDCFVGKTIMEELQISLNLAGLDDSKESVYNSIDELNLTNILQGVDVSNEIRKILKLNPNKLSGGQKKLISIISSLIRAKNCEICLVDEPLNNLDIKHVRAICNILTYINKELKKSIILVSHCRVFPNITSSYMVSDGKLSKEDNQECFACFGRPNMQGYYD